MLTTISAAYQKILEVIVFLNVLALTLVVTIGFASRLLGSPFSWYDEVASIGLAWLTYYGAALAALGSMNDARLVPHLDQLPWPAEDQARARYERAHLMIDFRAGHAERA